MFVGDTRQPLDVADVPRRIPDALAKDCACFLIDRLVDGLGPVGLGEADGYSLPGQQVGEQRVRGPVELRHGDDVGAELGDVDDRVIDGRLSGGHAHRIEAAFERRNPPLQNRRRRIGDAAVAKSFDLEVEKGRAMVRAVKRVRDGLINRDSDGLRRRIVLVSTVNGNRLASHAFTSRVTM